ncbi:MAG: PDGLE domain-containing protein, partial [Acidimicrobiia bacterium]|nr:PDGLE domain-containing protein [Acidimicrobiia bacterium]
MKSKGLVWFVVGLAVTVFVAVVVSQLASGQPDGLEYVADQQGFADQAEDHDLAEAPLAAYGQNLDTDDRVATGVAGLVGVAAALLVGLGLFWLIRAPKTDSPDA